VGHGERKTEERVHNISRQWKIREWKKKSSGRKGGRKTKEKGKLINFHLPPGNWKNGKLDDASSVK